MNCKAVHYEVGLLTSVAHLFRLLQQFVPFQHSAEYVVPGCKQLKLSMKDWCQRAFDLAIMSSIAATRKQKCECSTFIP